MSEFSENREISTEESAPQQNETSDEVKSANESELEAPETAESTETPDSSPESEEENEGNGENAPLETQNEVDEQPDTASETQTETPDDRYAPLEESGETRNDVPIENEGEDMGENMGGNEVTDEPQDDDSVRENPLEEPTENAETQTDANTNGEEKYSKFELPDLDNSKNEANAEGSKNDVVDRNEPLENQTEQPTETDNKDDISKSLNENAENETESDRSETKLEKSDDKPLPNEELGYHEGKVSGYDENKSDLQNAKDDLDYAIKERDAYKKAVNAKEIPKNPDISKQLDESVRDAGKHLKEVQEGQPYSYDRPSNFWESPKGRKMAGDIGAKVADEAAGKLADALGVEIPKGDDTVSNAAQNFGRFVGENYGYKVIGKGMDKTEDLMKNTHDTYTTPSEKFVNENFILRDADGNPITAEQGRALNFGEEE